VLAASVVAYGFMGRSILTEKISRRGHHIYREYGIDPLERHHGADAMTSQVVSVGYHDCAGTGAPFPAAAGAPRVSRHARRWLPWRARPDAPYGVRIDVTEELGRLSAQLAETRHILEKDGQVAKRLDFMMQELNREANTLGAKASIKELADASMELKLPAYADIVANYQLLSY
jgi:hypothetical protein